MMFEFITETEQLMTEDRFRKSSIGFLTHTDIGTDMVGEKKGKDTE